METGDRLNIAFVKSTLNSSMLAEVDDLDTTVDDDQMRSNLRCSTPVPEFEAEETNNVTFDVSCRVDGFESADICDICDGMAAITVKADKS